MVIDFITLIIVVSLNLVLAYKSKYSIINEYIMIHEIGLWLYADVISFYYYLLLIPLH